MHGVFKHRYLAADFSFCSIFIQHWSERFDCFCYITYISWFFIIRSFISSVVCRHLKVTTRRLLEKFCSST